MANSKEIKAMRLGKILSVVAMAIGALGLIGWYGDVDFLTRIHPHLTVMAPPTALGVTILGSIAYLTVCREYSWKGKLLLCLPLLIPFILSAIKIIEVLSGHSFGLEKFSAWRHIDQMSIIPAACLCIQSVALTLIIIDQNPKRSKLGQALGLATFFVGMVIFTTYIFLFLPSINIRSHTIISFQSSLALILVSLSLFLAKPSEGWMATITSDTIGGLIARRLLIATITLPILLGWIRILMDWVGLFNQELGTGVLIVLQMIFISIIILKSSELLCRFDHQRRLARANLEALNHNLEVAILERTQEIESKNRELQKEITARREAQHDLQTNNEKLQNLNRILTDFTAAASHELRTPLGAIKNSLEILLDELDGPLNEEQAEVAKIAKNNADRLTRILGNFLNSTALRTGQLQVYPSRTSMNRIIEDAVHLLETEAERKSIRLKTKLPPTNVEMDADGDKMRQVLINLIHNAIKFTPEEGEVLVDLEICEDHHCRLHVKDTGIGIDPSEHERIFTMFEQGSRKNGRLSQGSGIGLALAKRIIEAHHGTIKVKSRPNHGSHFTIELPCDV